MLTFSTHNIGLASRRRRSRRSSEDGGAVEDAVRRDLHAHGKEKLDELVTYVKETTKWLNRPVEDLDDVGR